jgi:alkylation response protein AidB-like acyl-CoA dehydrogenase
MNFHSDPSDTDFGLEVRNFVAQNLPTDIAERVRRTCHPSRADVAAWMAILHRRGWSAVGWPAQFGGPGWSGSRRLIFEEECLMADAPPQHFANIHSVGPVIYTFGTTEQKRRHLEPLLKGDQFWCQGFSEPNAGSDLAALNTRAIRNGDHYLVNGQKTWTSDAHEADFMFALVRTDCDVPQQQGISFLLIDMKSPGVRVRPIKLLDQSHVVSEIFFDNLKVPLTNRVGEEGQGWAIAKFLLANERAFSAEVPNTKRDLNRLIALAKAQNRWGSMLWDDPLFRAEIVRLKADLDALEYTVLRVVMSAEHDGTQLSSLVKIPGSELRQRVSELAAEAISTYGVAFYPSIYSKAGQSPQPGPPEAQGISETFTYRRATTIYGGSSEIQREIISKSLSHLA